MAPTAVDVREPDWHWRQKFVSDVFHTISQPLTALQCSLEFALKRRSVDEQQSAIRDALAMTARAIDSVKFIRLLAEAEDPGEVGAVRLHGIVNELVEEMQPVAESRGSKIVCRVGTDIAVRADEARLRQALFLLTDRALQRGGDLHIGCRKIESSVVIAIGARYFESDAATESIDSCGDGERAVVLARTMIRALGGEVSDWRSAEHHCFVVRLPSDSGPCA
ncbi:MAG TPA: hypothetical protein VD837_13485 [Terriglobales bacterium]|nr:hypothetical protein [Terriglobales bacterium]